MRSAPNTPHAERGRWAMLSQFNVALKISITQHVFRFGPHEISVFVQRTRRTFALPFNANSPPDKCFSHKTIIHRHFYFIDILL